MVTQASHQAQISNLIRSPRRIGTLKELSLDRKR
jgi:hypothetical protein